MKAEAGGKHTAHAAEAGRNPAEAVLSAEARVAARTRAKAEARSKLMEAVVERGNLQRAYQRVVENKGAAGVDDLDVSELKAYLQQHWPAIRALPDHKADVRRCAEWTSPSRKAGCARSASRPRSIA